MGVIDVEAPSALLAVSGADVVVIAVPVGAMGATLNRFVIWSAINPVD